LTLEDSRHKVDGLAALAELLVRSELRDCTRLAWDVARKITAEGRRARVLHFIATHPAFRPIPSDLDDLARFRNPDSRSRLIGVVAPRLVEAFRGQEVLLKKCLEKALSLLQGGRNEEQAKATALTMLPWLPNEQVSAALDQLSKEATSHPVVEAL